MTSSEITSGSFAVWCLRTLMLATKGFLYADSPLLHHASMLSTCAPQALLHFSQRTAAPAEGRQSGPAALCQCCVPCVAVCLAADPEEMRYLLAMAHRALYDGHYGALASLYVTARDVTIDAPGVDVRAVRLGGDRVVVWYGEDDAFVPPSHGAWLAQHFGAQVRMLNGYGHAGATVIDMAQFLEVLIGPAPETYYEDMYGGPVDLDDAIIR
eukprot:4646192-Prymnesium_polylepis.1